MTEQPPRIKGYMYADSFESEGASMSVDIITFDQEMAMFREQRGPPPVPLAREVRGEPIVAQYNSWYKRVGSSLAQKWFAQNGQKKAQKKAQPAPVARPPSPPPAPKRIMEPPSALSGW